MKNLTIVHSSEIETVLHKLSAGAHITNGTYAYSPSLILPTTLVGFEYVSKLKKLPLIVAINSDKSMNRIGKSDYEEQNSRANKVGIPLSKHFSDHQIIIIFFDEETPTSLYKILSKYKVTTTLHKWGYGTNPSAPKIEGAEFFDKVYAFPLLNDKKPVCWDITKPADLPQKVDVVDLRSQFILEDTHETRYNIALVPEREEDQQRLIEIARKLAEVSSVETSYLLGGQSFPHVSLFQFVLNSQPYPPTGTLFARCRESYFELLLDRISSLCSSMQVMPDYSNTLSIAKPTVHQKNDEIGPYEGYSWIDISVSTQENTFIQKLHEEIYKIVHAEFPCMNAHSEHYRPHFTLFNFLNLTQETPKLEITHEDASVLLNMPVKLVIGKANQNWELTHICYEVESFHKKSDAKYTK